MIKKGDTVVLKNCKVEIVSEFEAVVELPEGGLTALPLDAIEKQGHWQEAPQYLKNVIAKLRELNTHDRDYWIGSIMREFGKEVITNSYRAGLEQGRLEGFVESYYEKKEANDDTEV